jgi:hypothetical protein
VGFEASDLYCFGCLDQGAIWVNFADTRDGIHAAKTVKRLAHEWGTINVTLEGTFETGDVYGHLGGYSFQIKADKLSRPEVLDRSGFSPQAMPSETRKKACKGE